MKLHSAPLVELHHVDTEAGAGTLAVGVEDFYPAELTTRYTNGIAITHIRTPGQAQRIIYAPCVERKITVVEYSLINGHFVAHAPPELAGDNAVEGQAVNPIFLWIDTGDGREQLRLYCTAPHPDNGGIWTVRFTFPDLPIYRVRQ